MPERQRTPSGKGTDQPDQNQNESKVICLEAAQTRRTPLASEMEIRRLDQEQHELLQAKRLVAVRETYWELTASDHHDRLTLQSVLSEAGICDAPSEAHLKALFMLLPFHIFAMALEWGLSDKLVHIRTYEFVIKNRAVVLNALVHVQQLPT